MVDETILAEFKEQILAECQEVGNIALVARRHQIFLEHHLYLDEKETQERLFKASA